MFSGSDHLNQYNVQTIHILIGDVLHDIVHQPQPQMLTALTAYVVIGHLARQKRVEGLPPRLSVPRRLPCRQNRYEHQKNDGRHARESVWQCWS